MPNGLVVLAETLPQAQSVAFVFSIRAGSVYESRHTAGLASFVCEMILRGTQLLDSRAFLETVDRIGIVRSESVSTLNTDYCAAMLAENLESALRLYADLLRRPSLPRHEMDAGRRVLLQEILAAKDDPEYRLGRAINEQFYGFHWGHSPDGDDESVSRISWEDILGFYEAFYRPNKTILSIAGAFDLDRLESLLLELFGDWEARPAPDLPPIVPSRGLRHIPFDSSQTHLGLAWELVPISHPQFALARAGVQILDVRLYDEVREKRGLAYSIDATCHLFPQAAGAICTAATRAEFALQTLQIIRDEVERLKDGVSLEELSALKVRRRSDIIMLRESASSWAAGNLMDWVYLGRVRDMEEILDSIRNLSLEALNEYLRQHEIESAILCTLGKKEPKIPPNIRQFCRTKDL